MIIELDGLWRMVTKLYLSDPMSHAYLMNDLVREIDRTSVMFNTDGRSVKGYMLVWRSETLSVHLWGEYEPLLNMIPEGKAVIQIWGREEPALVRLRGRREEFVDMVVDERGFNPVPGGAIRLRHDDEGHVEAFLRIKEVQGREINEARAKELLRRWRYYGLLEKGELLSIACAYIRMPEVWIVGDVFTVPEARGRGYAKIATSAITRDAISSGAVAMLHVSSTNSSAMKVYMALGYRPIRTRSWVFVE